MREIRSVLSEEGPRDKDEMTRDLFSRGYVTNAASENVDRVIRACVESANEKGDYTVVVVDSVFFLTNARLPNFIGRI